MISTDGLHKYLGQNLVFSVKLFDPNKNFDFEDLCLGGENFLDSGKENSWKKSSWTLCSGKNMGAWDKKDLIYNRGEKGAAKVSF